MTEVLAPDDEYKDSFQSTLGYHETRTRELYRTYMPGWNWYAPIIVIVFWILPLLLLSIVAVMFGYAPLIILFGMLACGPYLVLKKGRRVYFIVYHKLIWNMHRTAVFQRIWKSILKIKNITNIWKNLKLKKKKTPPREPSPPPPPSHMQSKDDIDQLLQDLDRSMRELEQQ